MFFKKKAHKEVMIGNPLPEDYENNSRYITTRSVDDGLLKKILDRDSDSIGVTLILKWDEDEKKNKPYSAVIDKQKCYEVSVVLFYGFWENEKFKDVLIIHTNCCLSAWVVSVKEAEILKDYEKCHRLYYINGKSVSQNDYFTDTSMVVISSDLKDLFPGSVSEYKTVDKITGESTISYLVPKNIVEKDYVQVDANFGLVITPLTENWVLKSDYEKVLKELKKPHKVYKIIGTDKPPYFIINGKNLVSNTESWYEFVLYKFFQGKVQEWMLQEAV